MTSPGAGIRRGSLEAVPRLLQAPWCPPGVHCGPRRCAVPMTDKGCSVAPRWSPVWSVQEMEDRKNGQPVDFAVETNEELEAILRRDCHEAGEALRAEAEAS